MIRRCLLGLGLTVVLLSSLLKTQAEGTGKGTEKLGVCVYGFHSFRHGFITGASKNGMNGEMLQAMVGWGSPAMQKVYNHNDPIYTKQFIDMMPDYTKQA